MPPAQHILAAVYAAGQLPLAARPRVMDTIRKGMRWSGALDHVFITHLSGLDRGRDWSTAAFRDPVQWALGVLGLADETAPRRCPHRIDVQRQFRDLLRDAHPDHGGDIDDAAQRIADLTEARRILLRSVSPASEPQAGRRPAVPRGRELVAAARASSRSRRRWRRSRCGAATSPTGARAARLPTARPSCSRASWRRPAASPTELDVAPNQILLGGRSMGGRICSHGRRRRAARRRPRADQLPAAPAGPAGPAAHRAPARPRGAVPVRVRHPRRLRHP